MTSAADILLNLLVSFGLCFGLQNKCRFLYSATYLLAADAGHTTPVLWRDRLLACTYCTGFHCGLLVWAYRSFLLPMRVPSWGDLLWAPIWAFASAAFCYAVDALIQMFEASR